MKAARRSFHIVLVSGTTLCAYGPAWGQFTSQFEAPTYTGSAAGTLTTGQAGWYLPVTSPLSLDHNIFTTAGNAVSIPANPNGCGQFDAGVGLTTALGVQSARAQHAVDFSAGGVWEVSYDATGHWSGTLPAVDNLGSWSMQPSTTSRYFQTLMSWGSNAYVSSPNVTAPPPNHTTTGDKFHVHIGFFNTTTIGGAAIFAAPDPAWIDIPVDHWVRVKVKWDFGTATILQTSIQDLTAGTAAVVTDVSTFGWFLQGGVGSLAPLPTDIRVFAGGSSATGSDVTAWDNISIGPVTAPALPSCASTCYANCDSSTTAPCLNVLDFSCFLNQFASGATYANCDQSTTPPVLNVLDFSCFLNTFAAGCSSC